MTLIKTPAQGIAMKLPNIHLTILKEDAIKPLEGTLYLLEIELLDVTVVKVGITSRKIEDRCKETTESYWKHTRVFPRVYTKRFRRVIDYEAKEKQLLKYLKEYAFVPECSISGKTEMFIMNLEVAAIAYEDVCKGVDNDSVKDFEVCNVCGKLKKFLLEGTYVCGHLCETTT